MLKDNFDKDGYVIIENFFKDLKEWEETVRYFYNMQCKKIGREPNNVMDELEKYDPRAGYHVQQLLNQSIGLANITLAVQPVCNELLGTRHLNYISGVLTNMPTNDRLKYTFHSEVNYYAKRRNFLNLWFPIFGDKTRDNGTMIVKKGSHRLSYDFQEWKSGKDSFTQYEITDHRIDDFESVPIEARRGDLIIFDKNMVHSSSQNSTDNISYATVIRVFDVRKDPTLSGELGVKPYNDDLGKSTIDLD